MKTIIFSDVHGNLDALNAVLRFIEEFPGAQICSLGDIVGYGANPKECLAEVRKIAHVSLVGNHDYAAVGLTSIKYFNPNAKEAIIWTANQLDNQEKDYLSGLSLTKEFPEKLFLVHSSPLNPERWDYIMSLDDAEKNFLGFKEPLCFIGHSHFPVVIGSGPEGNCYIDDKEIIHLKSGHRYIINVGSVGQPRDGDWRACLLIYDDESQTIEFKRLEYDLSAAQTKILKARLPIFLAERLQFGR